MVEADPWRVFVGLTLSGSLGEIEYAHHDRTYRTYREARDVMEQQYRRWRDDSCESCVRTAASDEARLLALPDYAEFAGEVEGDDYLLIRTDRVTWDDL